MSESEQVVTEAVIPFSKPKRLSPMIIILLTIIVMLVIGIFAYGYTRLIQVNTSLVSTVAGLKQELVSNQREMDGIQQSLENVQKMAGSAASQDEKLSNWMAAQQGDRSKWDVTEAQHLTKLAEHYLQLTRDTAAALILLQQAQEILQKTPDNAVDSIRQALATNIASLQAQPEVNGEKIYQQLAAIYNQLDSLPLPATPLQYKEEAATKINDATMPWWKVEWHKSMEALKKVVLVRYNESNEMPLILPEAKMFLYQNLHTQMDAAMLSVLNHNEIVYRTSLEHVTNWIKKYFVQDAPLTIKILEQLQTLQAASLQPPVVDMATTLKLFDDYLAQKNNQPQPAVTP